MRNPDRIPRILDLIREYWLKHPDLRLGQLLSNASTSMGYTDTYYLEDDYLEMCLEQLQEVTDEG